MNRRISFTLAATLFAFAGIATGCASDPFTPPSLISIPKAGSTYTFNNYSKDTLGMKDPTTETTTTRTLLTTNATIGGKSGVVQYLEGTDTISMHYESNGDVSYYLPAMSVSGAEVPGGTVLPDLSVASQWVLFPYTTKTAQSLAGMDTNVTVTDPSIPFPLNINVKVTGTTTAIGVEDLTVGAETLTTWKGLLTVTSTATVPLFGQLKTTSIDTIWFAPKLGMFVKDDGLTRGEFPAQFGGNRIMGGTFNVLTAYSLK